MHDSKILLRLSQALTSSLDPDLLLHNITTSMAQAIEADKALMLISDDASTGQLRVAAAFETSQFGELPAEADWRVIDLAYYPPLVHTIRSQTRHMIDQQHASKHLGAMAEALDCTACNSILLQPFVYEKRVLGILALMAGVQRDPFTRADSDFCATWAVSAARAIYHARQYRQLRAQASKLLQQQQEAAVPFSILESIVDGVLVSDEEGRVQLVNQMAQEMLGAGREELLGKPISAILKQVPMFGGESAEQGEPVEHQITFPLRDRVLQGSMSAVADDAGQFLGAVAILRDVTQIHRAEQAKEKFVTTASHELRTPLTAMKGYIELLNSGVAGPLTAGQREFIEVIQRNAERMVDLVNSLIFVTQMQHGRMVPTHGHADLRQIINQIIREDDDFALQRQVNLVADLSDDPLVIQADPIQIHLVIERLVNNGIKYTPAGGTVTIAARIQPGGGGEEAGFAVVSVADTGVGIPPEQQVNVFEQFYRLDDRDIGVRAGGMGVGLSIVKTLVEAHGGRIWLESAVDKGSTFTFIVPVERRGSLPWLLKHTDDLLHRG